MVNNPVFIFPGQGAQYPGMGKDLYDHSPRVRELFVMASEAAGKDMAKTLFEGSAEDLKATDNTQIGITLVSLSVKALLADKGIVSKACAGFSLGELGAYADAGILSTEEVFKIVLERGRIMQKTCTDLVSSVGECGMAAVMGLDPQKVAQILSESGIQNVWTANWNSPVQVVISGTKQGIAEAEPLLKEAGARRVIALQVAGPFHSPLMASAAEAFRSFLDSFKFENPGKPCYSNVTGEQITSGEEAKANAPKHIISPVLWTTIEKKIAGIPGVFCYETGPGKVLTGLWEKGETDNLPCKPAGTLDEIMALTL